MNCTAVGSFPLMVTLDLSGINLENGRRFVLLFTVIMLISVFSNFALIAACFYHRFNSPMVLYIALASIADTFWGMVGISCFFQSTIAHRQEITFRECIFQMFCIHLSIFQQCLTMWMMYIDRHWAIFWPYSYVAFIANRGGVVKLAILVWTIGLLLSITFVEVAKLLVFCNTSVVIHDFTCSFGAISKSSSRNYNFPSTYTISILYLVFSLTGCTAMYSTWCIVKKCRKSTTEANVKALHTCFTQLFVCLVQFISLVVMTVLKRFVRHPMAAFIMDLIGVTTPAFINPLIFGFRIKEINLILLLAYQKLRSKYSESSIISSLSQNVCGEQCTNVDHDRSRA